MPKAKFNYEEIAKSYEDGLTLTQLKDKYGCPPSTVTLARERHRIKGRDTNSKYDIEGIAKDYRYGMTIPDIMKKYGCWASTVEQVRKVRGLQPRMDREDWLPSMSLFPRQHEPVLVFKERGESVSVILEEPGLSSKMRDKLCGEVKDGKLTLYVEPQDGGMETHLVNLTKEGTKKLLQLLTRENHGPS